jgi:hypothetical protein
LNALYKYFVMIYRRLALLFATFFAAACLHAQEVLVDVELPYNPDADGNEVIGVSDLTQLLAGFGMDFTAESIVVNGEELGVLLGSMLAAIESLQAQVEALESAQVPGLAEYLSVDVDSDLVQISGANVQIDNGMGDTYFTNGKGNLWLGYNEANDFSIANRGGSHNLILGVTHSYTGCGSLVQGHSNKAFASDALVCGVNNIVSGIRGATIGGNNNHASGEHAVVVGGQSATASGNSSVVVAGNQNEASGTFSAALGGVYNDALGLGTVAAGGRYNSVSGEHSGIFGGQYNTVDPASTGDAAGIFGGHQNSAFDGYVYGGKLNVMRGHCNAILGGYHLEFEAEPAVYPRFSVMVGGSHNTAPMELPDYQTIIGNAGQVFIEDALPAMEVQVVGE